MENGRLQYAALFVAIRQEVKEDFISLPTVLHASDIIEDECVETTQLLEQTGLVEIAFGDRQLLTQ